MHTSETIHPDQMEGHSEFAFRDLGAYSRVEQREVSVTVHTAESNMTFWYIAPGMLRIACKLKGDSTAIVPTEALLPYMPEAGWKVSEYSDRLELQGGLYRIVMDKSSLTMQIEYAEQKNCGTYKLSNAGSLVRFNGKMLEDAAIYGLGETTGYLNKRGERYTMWNSDVFDPHVPDMESLYQSIPFLIQHTACGSFGLFVDHPGKLIVDLREEQDAYSIQTENGEMDLYVIAGPKLKDVVSGFTNLTGKMQLPPLWSLGYQQSRFSYMNQEEVLQLAGTFREKQIPCDVIYLDIHYMDEYKVFTFDPVRFPDPKGMIQKLKTMGIRIVPIVDPGVKVEQGYEPYEQGVDQGYFCEKPDGEPFVGNVWPGASVFPDFTDEAVRQWWGALHRFYVDHGITGVWNDMNEPSVFNSATKTMDADVLHQNGGNVKTHEDIHNLYGMLMSKATYEGLERLLGGERPFVLTRAGCAGIQRYAAVWTGDNRSYWEHMELFISMGMNLGLSGVPFTGADIGGFMHHASGELLVRWTQLGVFTPFFRNHSAIETRRQEPWTFGDQVEVICRKYIELRYMLLPYLYSLFHASTLNGLPIMRPLVLEYPDDPRTFQLSDQFLLGADVLVAPVCRPGKEVRTVYLPDGIWYDFWTEARYVGGQHIMANAPLETLPLFVKAGAVVPFTSVRQHTDEARWTNLNIHVFGLGESDGQYDSASGEFSLYEDDGISDAYKQGASSELKINFEEKGSLATVNCKIEGNGSDADFKTLMFTFHALSFIPVGIQGISQLHSPEHLEEQRAGWYYDKQDNHLVVKLTFAGDAGFEFVIEG
ncbi:TIM-barrel domain-containing protein [Paenibacillus puldeungensis]|uniref:TIM-barrel domain-containing protein n=1 Tax=Paenibacillus puldeungensis TaxID=696536 RepID=A0ABW3RX23_9BACL